MCVVSSGLSEVPHQILCQASTNLSTGLEARKYSSICYQLIRLFQMRSTLIQNTKRRGNNRTTSDPAPLLLGC